MKHKNPEYLLYAGILEKWHSKTIHDFTNDDVAKRDVMKYVDRHVHMRKEGIGLYMYGSNSVGKTLLLNVIGKKLIELGYQVRITGMSDLITQFAGAWHDDETRVQLHERMLEVDFLGIDDIGKEYGTAYKENPLAIHVLDNVLRTRLQRNRPTLITTNIKPGDVKRQYSEDISSMLLECCLIIQVVGGDFRRKIQETLTKKHF